MKCYWLLLLIVVVPTGCTVITAGTTDRVDISSYPDDAQVTVNGKALGTTPVVLTSQRKTDLHIEVSKAGYTTVKVDDPAKFLWAYAGLDVLCYVVPLGVDLATGALYEHQTEFVAVHLQPVTTSADPIKPNKGVTK